MSNVRALLGARSHREPDLELIRTRVREILNRHPAVGFSVGLVFDGELRLFEGHGFQDIDSRVPVTADTVFRIGSITKTFTAIAVMQLWEQGLVDLDRPANDHLQSYKLVPASAAFRPATIRQLMTHTAGIPELVHPLSLLRPSLVPEERVAPGARIPTLAEFYGGRLPVVVQPGTRFMYTDHDAATLGQVVEDVTGLPFDRYLREHLFHPLGMHHTDVVRSPAVASALATGYRFRRSEIVRVPDYELVTVGGGGAFSSTGDLARYLVALLDGGANEHGSVLKPATLAMMFEPHHQPDPRIPGDGLVFSRADIGGRLAISHGGVLPGFFSQMWLSPADGVGIVALTNGMRGALFGMPTETSRLLAVAIGAPTETLRADIPEHPEVWPDLCGCYQPDAALTDYRTRMMVGAGVEVFVGRGQLMARVLMPIPLALRGFRLRPDDPSDPYVFKIDLSPAGLPAGRVVFRPSGDSVTAHFELHPISLRKQPPIRNPRYWLIAGLGLAGAGMAAARGRRRPRATGRRPCR